MVINDLLFFLIHKTTIWLKEIFHCQIWIHFSTRYEKVKPGWTTRWLLWTLQTNLGLSPTTMPQYIVVVQRTPLFLMISNKFRILELDYPPIHHPSLLILTLRHSQTWKVWHHHNIIIRIIKNKNIKLCLVPFTTKTSQITILKPKVLVDTVSMNPPRPIEPLFLNALP